MKIPVDELRAKVASALARANRSTAPAATVETIRDAVGALVFGGISNNGDIGRILGKSAAYVSAVKSQVRRGLGATRGRHLPGSFIGTSEMGRRSHFPEAPVPRLAAKGPLTPFDGWDQDEQLAHLLALDLAATGAIPATWREVTTLAEWGKIKQRAREILASL